MARLSQQVPQELYASASLFSLLPFVLICVVADDNLYQPVLVETANSFLQKNLSLLNDRHPYKL